MPESGSVIITPGYSFNNESVELSKLNLLGQPSARVSEGAIGLRELDVDALTEAVGSSLNNLNFFAGGNFEEPTWTNGVGPINLPSGVKTYTNNTFWTTAQGATATATRDTNVPDNNSLHALKITGASSVAIVDVGQDIKRYISSGLRKSLTVSWSIYNGTGAELTPLLRVNTADVADNFTAVTNRVSQALADCANGEWTKLIATFDATNIIDMTNGLQPVIRFPSGALNSGSKYVIISQAKLELGSAATPLNPIPPIALGEDDVKTVNIEDNAVTSEKLDITSFPTDNAPNPATDYIPYRKQSTGYNSKMLIHYAKVIKRICDGRLTLTSGTPVTTGNVSGASTIYFPPWRGNELSLFDGTAWRLYEFSELSLALSSMTSGRPQDIFIYDNSGTLTLERVEWSSTTARATAIVVQDGVIVQSGSPNKRYLGTLCATAATTVEDSDSKRYVWNYYNRVLRILKAVDGGAATYTYTTASYQEARAQSTYGVSRVSLVIGVSEDLVNAQNYSTYTNTNGANAVVGIGLDSSTANSAQITVPGQAIPVASGAPYCMTRAEYNGYPGIGVHDLRRLETAQAAGTTTWINNNTNAGTTTQTGLFASLWA